MVQTIQASKIEAIAQLIELFGLEKVDDPRFFPEWQEDLPELDALERQALDSIKKDYIYLSRYNNLEPIVKMVMIGPLLKLAGFYSPPFRVKAEHKVELVTEDEGTLVRGMLDLLVLHDCFWTMLIEAKRVQYSLDAGIPQALFYMLGEPDPGKPVFALVTNGPDFQFLKLVRSDVPRYSESDRFYLTNRHDELYQVLQILKKFGQLVQQ
jgi:hypothetical protein